MDKTTSEELEKMVECTWEGWGPQSSLVYKTCCAWQKISQSYGCWHEYENKIILHDILTDYVADTIYFQTKFLKLIVITPISNQQVNNLQNNEWLKTSADSQHICSVHTRYNPCFIIIVIMQYLLYYDFCQPNLWDSPIIPQVTNHPEIVSK